MLSRVENDQRKFSIQSRALTVAGGSVGTRSPTWVKVDVLNTPNFQISIYAPQEHSARIATFLGESAGHTTGVQTDQLGLAFASAERFLFSLVDERAIKAQVNLHLTFLGDSVVTPASVWQPGPVVDPVTLNLVMFIPEHTDGKRVASEQSILRWHDKAVRLFAHEYMHVVQANAPSPPRSALADEFIAYAVDHCMQHALSGFSPSARVGATEVASEYRKDPSAFFASKPFAISSTGEDLAILAASLFFSRPELVNAPLEKWDQAAPKYCRMIAQSVPDFSTTKMALDWIENNIWRKPITFLNP